MEGSNPYLEAVLVRHELLSLALVRGLQQAPRRLRAELAASGPIAVLRQVEVSHLHTDLITHDVLQLRASRRGVSAHEDASPCPLVMRAKRTIKENPSHKITGPFSWGTMEHIRSL